MKSPFAAPVTPGPAAPDAFEKLAAPDALAAVDRAGWADLPPDHYADPPTRQYPVHTPEAAAASAACYHYLRGPLDHPVAGRIKAACEFWDLGGTWVKFAAAAAAKPSRHCLPGLKKYPVDTPEQARKAAAYLAEYGDRFAPAVRREYATNLLAAADDLGADLPDRVAVEQAAGLGRPADLAGAFAARKAAATLAGRDGLLSALETAERAVAGGADPYAAVDLLRQADSVCGWAFPDPTEALTGLTPTAAKEAMDGLVVAAGGDVYARADLARLPADVAAGWGLAAAGSLAKRAALLRVEPAFEAALKAFGVEPVGSVRRAEVLDWDALATD